MYFYMMNETLKFWNNAWSNFLFDGEKEIENIKTYIKELGLNDVEFKLPQKLENSDQANILKILIDEVYNFVNTSSFNFVLKSISVGEAAKKVMKQLEKDREVVIKEVNGVVMAVCDYHNREILFNLDNTVDDIKKSFDHEIKGHAIDAEISTIIDFILKNEINLCGDTELLLSKRLDVDDFIDREIKSGNFPTKYVESVFNNESYVTARKEFFAEAVANNNEIILDFITFINDSEYIKNLIKSFKDNTYYNEFRNDFLYAF